MNVPKLLILILVLCYPLNLFYAAEKSKVLRPKNAGEKISIVVSGKNRNYYPLSNNEPSIISVKGPGKLKVITRVQFISERDNAMDYNVFYRLDGAKKKEVVEFENVKRSNNSTYKKDNEGIPGARKDLFIELSRGEHTVEFWSGVETSTVAARYVFTKAKEKPTEWVSLSPLNPAVPVDLCTRENVIHYYRFSIDKPLKIKINGPSYLRVLNRIENHYHMKGRINYRLQVKEDGRVKNTYLLNSVRSEITSYKNGGTKIPGKAKEIVINVPDGTHNYEIIPLDKDKSTILARILFPKKDVKLEE